MTVPINEQCARLFEKSNLTVESNDVHYVSAKLIIKKPNRRTMGNVLTIRVFPSQHIASSYMEAELCIDVLEIPIVASQKFETVEELEKLITNNHILNSIIKNKNL